MFGHKHANFMQTRCKLQATRAIINFLMQPSLLKKWVLALASVFVTAPTTPSRNIACTSYILSSGNTGFGGFECDRLVLPTVVIKIRKMEAFLY